MSSTSEPHLIIVGSVGIDSIETPQAKRENLLGGSASYACAAASFFSEVGMVGIVGTDFDEQHTETFRHFGIDLEGLQREEGETFKWSGVYEENMNNRSTLSTELGVFADFNPELPPSYRAARYLFLANIHPGLQLHVLDQMEQTDFVMADTMDLWINVALDDLKKVIARVDLLTMNESEAAHYTGLPNLIEAGQQLLSEGPTYVIIKKGEHGSMLFSPSGMFLLPAYPLDSVSDPTGAGDTFAGGLMGHLASGGGDNPAGLREAMLYGSVVASHGVEAFSLDRLKEISRKTIEERVVSYRSMLTLSP